jgi:hypothetical protein
MKTATVKSDLQNIANTLPDSASYKDAMYQLYVKMKIANGKEAVNKGDMKSHEAVKKMFGHV